MLNVVNIAYALEEISGQNVFHYGDKHFSFNIPQGWHKLPDSVLESRIKDLELHRKEPLTQKPILAFNRIGAVHPFEVPYFTISAGTFVIDDSEINRILNSLQKTMGKAARKEEGSLYKDTLIESPTYDKEKHIATIAVDSKLTNNKVTLDIKLLTVFFFYKDGVVVITFYLPLDGSSKYIPIVKSLINTFKFDSGYEYTSR